MRPDDAIARLPVPARRWAYRAAHAVLRVWWFVRRPHSRGVKCVVRHDGQVLFIRHTYGDRRAWELPGGGIGRGESPPQAVIREAREELGITPVWHPVTVLVVRCHRINELHVFTAEVSSPDVTPDPGEIAEVRWASPADPPRPLSALTAEILKL